MSGRRGANQYQARPRATHSPPVIQMLDQTAGKYRDGNSAVVARQQQAADFASPPSDRRRLPARRERDMRRAAANDWSCPAAALELLAADPEFDVRHAVATNPSCPAATFPLLAGDQSAIVRCGVPNCLRSGAHQHTPIYVGATNPLYCASYVTFCYPTVPYGRAGVKQTF
jgi:hypothetical protein